MVGSEAVVAAVACSERVGADIDGSGVDGGGGVVGASDDTERASTHPKPGPPDMTASDKICGVRMVRLSHAASLMLHSDLNLIDKFKRCLNQ